MPRKFKNRLTCVLVDKSTRLPVEERPALHRNAIPIKRRAFINNVAPSYLELLRWAYDLDLRRQVVADRHITFFKSLDQGRPCYCATRHGADSIFSTKPPTGQEPTDE